jgi:hypothetical protein
MILLDILNDKRQPSEIPTPELNEMMMVIRAAKFWAGPYFTLSQEQHRRAVHQWVREDVFGERDES